MPPPSRTLSALRERRSVMESSTRFAPRSLVDPLPGLQAPVPTLYAAGIVGLGSYAPERILTNEDMEAIVETSDEWIVTRTGIRERPIAHPEERTSDLACKAAGRALGDAGLDPGEIDLVIVATVTGDHAFPATASLVQDRIGARGAA